MKNGKGLVKAVTPRGGLSMLLVFWTGAVVFSSAIFAVPARIIFPEVSFLEALPYLLGFSALLVTAIWAGMWAWDWVKENTRLGSWLSEFAAASKRRQLEDWWRDRYESTWVIAEVELGVEMPVETELDAANPLHAHVAKQVVADYRKAMHDLKGVRKPLDELPYHPRVVESAMEVLLELSRSGQLPEIPEDWVRFELMTIKDALGEDTTPT